MKRNPTDPDDGVSRRSVLAAGAAGLSLSMSGCMDNVRSVVSRDGDEELSLSILTVPTEDGRATAQIADHLEENLRTVGIDASTVIRSRSEFLEQSLIDGDFDIYVGRHPADYDPDFLYEALHSTYARANESGWQNPFGFASTLFDRRLEEQRRLDGDERRELFVDRSYNFLDTLAAEKPFDPICRPSEIRVARSDRFDGWDEDHRHLATRTGYLGLEPTDDDIERLTALVTDARPSRNVNPLSATVRERGTVVDLLYDSLGTVVYTDEGIEVASWLAESWTEVDRDEIGHPDDESNGDSKTDDESDGDKTPDDSDDKTTLEITLRDGCTFHSTDDDDDGEPVTARDVAFTYRFLEDTTLGQSSTPAPAPRYRGQTSAVDEVVVADDADDTLWLTVDGGRDVAERALTVPILPRHIWLPELEDRISDFDDFSVEQGEWSLVTTDSVEPIGSGPYRFESQSERSYLHLERFEDHFTLREDLEEDHLRGPLVDELRFSVEPNNQGAISRVENDSADLMSSSIDAHAIGRIPEDHDDVVRLEDNSWTFYHVGFNMRRTELGFRKAVCRLIDKEWIVENIFYDHAEPLATPVTDAWTPDRLAWDGEDPETPFIGTDGDVNVEAAHAMLESEGYTIDEDGAVLRRG